jgi:hypothetical protein
MNDANTCDHIMRLARKQAKHSFRIGRIGGLPKHLPIDHDDGVRSQYLSFWKLLSYRGRFFSRQALPAVNGSFVRHRRLIDIRGMNAERNAGITQ